MLFVEAGANVEIGTTGNARVIEQAYKLTHADVKTIFGGVPKMGDNFNINFLPHPIKKVHIGSHFFGARLPIDISRYVRLREACKGKLDVHTYEFMLDESNEATDVVRSGDAGRVPVARAQGRH